MGNAKPKDHPLRHWVPTGASPYPDDLSEMALIIDSKQPQAILAEEPEALEDDEETLARGDEPEAARAALLGPLRELDPINEPSTEDPQA